MEFSVDEIALVVATFELKLSFSSLLSIDEVACVLDLALVPDFGSEAVLFIVDPLTIIH